MKYFGVIIIAAAVVLGVVFSVSAEPTKIVPFVSLKQEYSDNILFSNNSEKEDYITTVSGGIVLNQKTEVLNARLQARLDQLFYHDYDQLNSLDKFFSGNVNYKTTERLGLGATARYSETSRKDQDADTTGLLQSGDREAAQFSLSSDYQFSEVTRGDITLGYGLVEVDEINNSEENDNFKIDISFSKNLSQTFKNTTGIFNLSYLRYSADVETSTPVGVFTSTAFQENITDIFQFSTGFSKNITELYTVYCQVGASYSLTDESLRTRNTVTGTGALVSEVISPEQEDEIWGGVLLAGLNYSGLYYDIGLTLSQDMRGASGTNGAVERSSVAGNIDGKLTDEFSFTFDASCYLNQNERNNQADTDELTLNIQPGFKYKFDHDFILSCFYRYTSVENRQNNTSSERNLIYIVIKKEFEL